jgi:uncharacterized protein YbjT (DUF2867 family)
MRILLTGANGFIGRYLLAHLLSEGHIVIPAVRNPHETDRLLPRPASLHADFNRDVTPEAWVPRLAGVDAVVNCAGVLQGSRGQSIAAIHTETPKALFRACEIAGVRRVIQISAISVGADTQYARTKLAADEFLASTSLDWVILRPSLVYAEGAYGGTALFRALAASPFAVPLVGGGLQVFQPIHVSDLAAAVNKIVGGAAINRVIIEPVGPDRLTMREMLIDLRRWLGLREAPALPIPMPLVRLMAGVGDIVGGTINMTALRQLECGNAAPVEPFVAATGIYPQRWRDSLLAHPAQVQDRWHARLFFVRPLLRASIGLTWIGSAVSGIANLSTLQGQFNAFGISLSTEAIWATCLIDLLVGIAVLARWRTGVISIAQLIIVAAYTVALSIAAPSLWLEPFGPLLKNIPFVVAVLALAALERER